MRNPRRGREGSRQPGVVGQVPGETSFGRGDPPFMMGEKDIWNGAPPRVPAASAAGRRVGLIHSSNFVPHPPRRAVGYVVYNHSVATICLARDCHIHDIHGIIIYRRRQGRFVMFRFDHKLNFALIGLAFSIGVGSAPCAVERKPPYAAQEA